tara:strand:+ start:167 stop:448 length:282 start_codon:yes stop_codon:yes gene_type:complete
MNITIIMGNNLTNRLRTITFELPVHAIKTNQNTNGRIEIRADIQAIPNHPCLNCDLEKTYKTKGITNSKNNPQTTKKCMGLEVISVTGDRPEN